MAKESSYSQGLLAALSALDIGNPDQIKRVVIDLDFSADRDPVIYVEHYGDERLIEVVKAITKAEIVRE